MKKIILGSFFLTALSFVFTGCLKDKGFENFEYGINDPDTQPPGVGFPRAAAAKYTVGINLSPTPQAINGVVFVNLEAGNPASSDVHITLQLNDALRVAYNAANGTNILALNPSLYNVELTLTIPAGGRFAEVPINVPNASGLDPNSSYGLGFTIVSVDGGYKIADNLKNLLVEIGVKNKYDGRFNLKGVHNRSPYLFPFNLTVEMWTTGPASVAMYLPAPFGDFGQPIGTAPGVVSWYGPAVSPNFVFDPATNLAIDVLGMPANAVTLGLVTNDVVADANPNGPIVNRYEPGPKKMYLTFQYNGNDLRRFYDTLTYLGPR